MKPLFLSVFLKVVLPVRQFWTQIPYILSRWRQVKIRTGWKIPPLMEVYLCTLTHLLWGARFLSSKYQVSFELLSFLLLYLIFWTVFRSVLTQICAKLLKFQRFQFLSLFDAFEFLTVRKPSPYSCRPFLKFFYLNHQLCPQNFWGSFQCLILTSFLLRTQQLIRNRWA